MQLYFECAMGASGDMLAGALLDLLDDKEAVLAALNGLSLPHTVVTAETATAGGIGGTHVRMLIDGAEETPDGAHTHHHGRRLEEVTALIDGLTAPVPVKEDAKAIYTLIAAAEAAAHRQPVGEVHFHELGMWDAIADVTVCAYLMHRLQPDAVLASPVNVGNGTVHCAHGVLPVPTPATEHLLRGIPYYKSEIETELCTPTGAAILKYYVQEFTDTPPLGGTVRTGIGTGTKQLPQANLLRVFQSEADERIAELACNIDDMTGEEAAFAAERMMAAGALDCFITPSFMKKGRPAYLLTVLCRPDERERFAALLFQHTTTLGIRLYLPSRYTLHREQVEENGVLIKRAKGYGTQTEKLEFEAVKRYALEQDISLFEARRRLTEQAHQ